MQHPGTHRSGLFLSCAVVLAFLALPALGQWTQSRDADPSSPLWWTLSDEITPGELARRSEDPRASAARHLGVALASGCQGESCAGGSPRFFVDGSRTPELVPLWFAFHALAQGTEGDPGASFQRISMLNREGMSSAGVESVVEALEQSRGRARELWSETQDLYRQLDALGAELRRRGLHREWSRAWVGGDAVHLAVLAGVSAERIELLRRADANPPFQVAAVEAVEALRDALTPADWQALRRVLLDGVARGLAVQSASGSELSDLFIRGVLFFDPVYHAPKKYDDGVPYNYDHLASLRGGVAFDPTVNGSLGIQCRGDCDYIGEIFYVGCWLNDGNHGPINVFKETDAHHWQSPGRAAWLLKEEHFQNADRQKLFDCHQTVNSDGQPVSPPVEKVSFSHCIPNVNNDCVTNSVHWTCADGASGGTDGLRYRAYHVGRIGNDVGSDTPAEWNLTRRATCRQSYVIGSRATGLEGDDKARVILSYQEAVTGETDNTDLLYSAPAFTKITRFFVEGTRYRMTVALSPEGKKCVVEHEEGILDDSNVAADLLCGPPHDFLIDVCGLPSPPQQRSIDLTLKTATGEHRWEDTATTSENGKVWDFEAGAYMFANQYPAIEGLSTWELVVPSDCSVSPASTGTAEGSRTNLCVRCGTCTEDCRTEKFKIRFDVDMPETFSCQPSPEEPGNYFDVDLYLGPSLASSVPVGRLNADGDTFPVSVDDGSGYSVRLSNVLDCLNCDVIRGEGTVAGSDVGDVLVYCEEEELTPHVFSYTAILEPPPAFTPDIPVVFVNLEAISPRGVHRRSDSQLVYPPGGNREFNFRPLSGWSYNVYAGSSTPGLGGNYQCRISPSPAGTVDRDIDFFIDCEWGENGPCDLEPLSCELAEGCRIDDNEIVDEALWFDPEYGWDLLPIWAWSVSCDDPHGFSQVIPGPFSWFRQPGEGRTYEGDLTVRGVVRDDTWGVVDAVLLLDGQPVTATDFRFREYDEWTCQELPGSGPAACDANSGFSATIPAAALSEGWHTLAVVSKNGASPQAAYGRAEVTFQVGGEPLSTELADLTLAFPSLPPEFSATVRLTAQDGQVQEVEVPGGGAVPFPTSLPVGSTASVAVVVQPSSSGSLGPVTCTVPSEATVRAGGTLVVGSCRHEPGGLTWSALCAEIPDLCRPVGSGDTTDRCLALAESAGATCTVSTECLTWTGAGGELHETCSAGVSQCDLALGELVCVQPAALPGSGGAVAQSHPGPALALRQPQGSAAQETGYLLVEGHLLDLENGLGALAFFVDGAAVEPLHLRTGLEDPVLCAGWSLPGRACDPRAVFRGYVPVAGMVPGTHALSVAASAGGPEPGVTLVERLFVLEPPACASDLTPPTVDILSPATSVAEGQHPFTAQAADASGLTSLELLIDGVPVAGGPTSPVSHVWNATAGTYTLRAEATDGCGNPAYQQVTVEVTASGEPAFALSSGGGTVTEGQLVGYGPVPQGAVVGRTFTIRNDGAADLVFPPSAFSISNGEFVISTGPPTLVAANGGTATLGVATSGTAPVGPSRATVRILLPASFSDPEFTFDVAAGIEADCAQDGTAPGVTLGQPADPQLGQPVTLVATTSGNDVASVRFEDGTALIGEDATAPYSVAWTPSQAQHTLTARVYDHCGNTAAHSISVSFDACAGDATAPAISMTRPSGAGDAAPVGQPYQLQAHVGPEPNGISAVEFLARPPGSTGFGLAGAVNGPAPGSTVSAWATPSEAGVYTIKARVTDLCGNARESATVTLTAEADPCAGDTAGPAAVSLTAPAAYSTFGIGEPVALAASAAGDTVKVELYAGTTLLASDTAAPWGASHAFSVAGSYSLKARAFDACGNATDSAAVPVSVDPPCATPSLTQLVPAEGAVVEAGPLFLSARSSTWDGVEYVRFLVDGVQVGSRIFLDPDTGQGPITADASVSWDATAASLGAHVLTVESGSICGTVGSRDVGFTLVEPDPCSGDAAGPTVSITHPTGLETYEPGTLTIQATAADPNGVDRVRFYADGVLLCDDPTDDRPGYSCAWNATIGDDHPVRVEAFDHCGNPGSAQVPVDVRPTLSEPNP